MLKYANVDLMLDEMDGGQIQEWLAYEKIEAEADKRAELAAKAQVGVKNHKRRGR